jgi:hypothetical protein
MRARIPDVEGFIERDGVKVAYELYDNDAPTLLLLPDLVDRALARVEGPDRPTSPALAGRGLRRTRQRPLRSSDHAGGHADA